LKDRDDNYDSRETGGIDSFKSHPISNISSLPPRNDYFKAGYASNTSYNTFGALGNMSRVVSYASGSGYDSIQSHDLGDKLNGVFIGLTDIKYSRIDNLLKEMISLKSQI